MTEVKYWVKVYVNNKLVSTTVKYNLDWPNMTINIGQQYRLSLSTKPFSIRVEVCTGGFFSSVVGVIELDIPGDGAYTLTSTQEVKKTDYFAKRDPKGGKEIHVISQERQNEPLDDLKEGVLGDGDLRRGEGPDGRGEGDKKKDEVEGEVQLIGENGEKIPVGVAVGDGEGG